MFFLTHGRSSDWSRRIFSGAWCWPHLKLPSLLKRERRHSLLGVGILGLAASDGVRMRPVAHEARTFRLALDDRQLCALLYVPDYATRIQFASRITLIREASVPLPYLGNRT